MLYISRWVTQNNENPNSSECFASKYTLQVLELWEFDFHILSHTSDCLFDIAINKSLNERFQCIP